MTIQDLLQAMMSGAQAQQEGRQPGGDPLADLLGSILGGSAQGGGDLGSLLEAILGGAGGQPAGPMEGAQPGVGQAGLGGLADILGAILGAGGSEAGLSGALAPIVNSLAEKLGLPPQIAQMVVAFVLSKLLSGQRGGAAVPAPTPQPRGRRRAQPAQPQGLDLDALLERMGSEQGVDRKYLRATGMHKELASQTGLDPDTAMQSLLEVFGMLGGQMRASRGPQTPPQRGRGSGLDDLLDQW